MSDTACCRSIGTGCRPKQSLLPKRKRRLRVCRSCRTIDHCCSFSKIREVADPQDKLKAGGQNTTPMWMAPRDSSDEAKPPNHRRCSGCTVFCRLDTSIWTQVSELKQYACFASRGPIVLLPWCSSLAMMMAPLPKSLWLWRPAWVLSAPCRLLRNRCQERKVKASFLDLEDKGKVVEQHPYFSLISVTEEPSVVTVRVA